MRTGVTLFLVVMYATHAYPTRYVGVLLSQTRLSSFDISVGAHSLIDCITRQQFVIGNLCVLIAFDGASQHCEINMNTSASVLDNDVQSGVHVMANGKMSFSLFISLLQKRKSVHSLLSL